MLIVGLTGGIGSGKTTVSDLFKNLGINIIDTDVIAHDLVNNNQSVLDEIAAVFGHDVLNEDHSLNRKNLAKIIFGQKKHKAQLEDILHPMIHDEVRNQIDDLSVSSTPPVYVIVVIPLLFETQFNELINRVLVVMADETTRIQRVSQRDHRSHDEIQAIMDMQASDNRRSEGANDIIENNDDLHALELQIKQLHVKYSNPDNLDV